MSNPSNPPRKPLQVGIFFESVQVYDIICADILSSISTAMISGLSGFQSAESAAQKPLSQYIPSSIPIDFHWISTSTTTNRDEMPMMTLGMKALATTSYEDCPRDLDVVIIGGPALVSRPEGSLKLMRELVDTKTNPVRKEEEAYGKMGGKRYVMATCTGALWLASSGVLDGKRATVNRGAIEAGKRLHPEVDWVDQRWVVDGDKDGEGDVVFWTAGGAAAGVDMVASFAYEMFDKALVELGCELLDVVPSARGQFYKEPLAVSWA